MLPATRSVLSETPIGLSLSCCANPNSCGRASSPVDAMKQELARLQEALLDAGKDERRALKQQVRRLKKELKEAVCEQKAIELSETASAVSSVASNEVEKLRSELLLLQEALQSLPTMVEKGNMLAQVAATEVALAGISPSASPVGVASPLLDASAAVLTLRAERDLLQATLVEREAAHTDEVDRLAKILELVPMLEEELQQERHAAANLRAALQQVLEVLQQTPNDSVADHAAGRIKVALQDNAGTKERLGAPLPVDQPAVLETERGQLIKERERLENKPEVIHAEGRRLRSEHMVASHSQYVDAEAASNLTQAAAKLSQAQEGLHGRLRALFLEATAPGAHVEPRGDGHV